MKNLSPEIAESLKTLQEAAEMVNRPYQLDKEIETEKVVLDNTIDTIDEAEAVADLSSSPESRIKN